PLPSTAPGLTETHLSYLTGPSHGDLHAGNVLVPLDDPAGVTKHFRLVDYAHYRPTAPLSRDVTALLTSVVVPWFTRLGADQQSWMIRYLTGADDAAKAYLPPLF